MKIIHAEIFKKESLSNQSLAELNQALPEKFFLAYSIQYKRLAFEIKEALKSRIAGFSQVLGCSKINPQKTVLLVGEGKFHALNLLRFAEKVFVFDGKNMQVLGSEEKERLEKENLTKFKKILFEEKIGILVSTKPGQYNLTEAIKVKEELLKHGKQPYFFFFDVLNPLDLENYLVPAWINTSCLGISYDSKNIIDSTAFFSLLERNS